MTFRNRLQRLEELSPGEGLEVWTLRIVIGGHNAGTFAKNEKTGQESRDPALLEQLRKRLHKNRGPITFEITKANPNENDATETN